MSEVYDYDCECDALCPFTGDTCRTECMLMRYTGFGEPRCSMRVIADELVLISRELRDANENTGRAER